MATEEEEDLGEDKVKVTAEDKQGRNNSTTSTTHDNNGGGHIEEINTIVGSFAGGGNY